MNKNLQLICGLLATIAITSTKCNNQLVDSFDEELDGDQQTPNSSPVQQAMQVMEMISQFQDIRGRAMSAFPDPVKALAELTLFGAFKLGFVLISGLLLMGTLFPTLLAGLGLSAPFLVRSVGESVGDLKNLNYDMIQRSIRSLPEKSFEILNVKGDACQSRAVCEIGHYSARVFPTAAGYVRTFGNKFNFSQKHLSAMIKGMSKVDCGIIYRTCSESPFKKLSYLSTYNIL